MKKWILILCLFAFCLLFINSKDIYRIKVKSSAFKNGEFIPSRYTCEGENISPEICWKINIKNVKSFVLISDDPDAPMGTWVHWVVYDIPAKITCLQEAMTKGKILKNGIKQGKTSFGDFGYGGPCPPSGIHRYFFKVYALNIEKIDIIPEKADKNVILQKIKNNIIGYGELMGKYKRNALKEKL